MSRIENTSRNLFWGMMNKVVAILLPFITRTVILYKLGTEYLGLSSLFSAVLSVLSLSELGFGSALVYSMYEPVADNDNNKVNALLKLYRKCYSIIGVVILVIGLALLPFLRLLIKGSVPSDVNLYMLYVIYLANTVISYFLFAYKKSLFYANQRVDIDSNIATVIVMLQNMVQISVTLIFANYYVFAIAIPICTVLNNLYVSYKADKLFPDNKCEGELGKAEIRDIFKRVRGLIFQKIGGVVLFSVDNIVISAFLGLNMLTIYNNYYYVVTSLTGVLAIVMNSIKPSVGNSIVKESLEKNYQDFKKFNFIYVWIVAWMMITMMNLYQPFIKIWTGETLMLSNFLAILFAIYFFVNKWCDMMYVYQEAAGLWYENRFVPIIAAVMNLALNISLVQIIGLAGILISTVVSILLVYNIGYAYILFKYYFKNVNLMKEYFVQQLIYLLFIAAVACISIFLCNEIEFSNSYQTIIVRGVICVILPNIMGVLVARKNENFSGAVMIIKKMIHKGN